jgi:hypothetical protein
VHPPLCGSRRTEQKTLSTGTYFVGSPDAHKHRQSGYWSTSIVYFVIPSNNYLLFFQFRATS